MLSMNQNFQSILLRLILTAGLVLSGYLHLNVNKDGFNGLSLKLLFEAWPIFLLALAVIFLSVSIPLKGSNLGNLLAWYGIIIAWLYYLIMFCAYCSLMSVAMFLVPATYLFFAPCIVLLLITKQTGRAKYVSDEGT